MSDFEEPDAGVRPEEQTQENSSGAGADTALPAGSAATTSLLSLRFLRFTEEKTDGSAHAPTAEDIAVALVPRDGETVQAASERLMKEFSDAAAVIDRRGSAAATASALAVTISGLLLKLNSSVSSWVVALIAVLGFLGFLFGLLGQTLHLGKVPGKVVTTRAVEDAYDIYVRKEMYTQVSAIFALLALGTYAVAFVVTAHL